MKYSAKTISDILMYHDDAGLRCSMFVTDRRKINNAEYYDWHI